MTHYLDGYDYPSIHARAREVICNMPRLKKSAAERYEEYFQKHCRESRRTTEAAKEIIPGGIQHNLANNYPFALNCRKSEDAFLYDVDGNRYIDFLQAGGPTILGNNDPVVKKAVIDVINNTGHLTGLYGDFEYRFVKKLLEYYPSCDMFRMLASGTEACMQAIRLARAYTGRSRIIKIKGCYHGWSDQLMYEIRYIGSDHEVAVGVPDECYKYIGGVMPNDFEELRLAFEENARHGGTAAFLVEAIGQDSGALPLTKEYHEYARKLCDKYGAMLIYDEVVTALRLGMGGAQERYGVQPDITVFGKIVAGGYPGAGGVGARREIMQLLTAGIATGKTKSVMVGGTLTANPISCTAGYTTICELERRDAHKALKAAGDQFTRSVADLAEKYGLPALIFNQESILHIDLCGWQHVASFTEWSQEEIADKRRAASDAMHEFSMAMAVEGIIVAGGNKTFLSLAAIKTLDDALSAIERVFQNYE